MSRFDTWWVDDFLPANLVPREHMNVALIAAKNAWKEAVLRDDDDYQASYMMSNETLQHAIETTSELAITASARFCSEQSDLLKEHLYSLLTAQAKRADAVVAHFPPNAEVQR